MTEHEEATQLARSRIVDQAYHIKNPRSRRVLLLTLVVLLMFLFGGWGFAAYGYFQMRDAARAGTGLAQQLQTACDRQGSVKTPSGQDLCDRADRVVDDAPSAAQGPKGDKGDTGPAGVPGTPPSNAQVANAVALYCAGGKCDGPAGRSVTTTQVAAAVASYCGANGKCKGPTGNAGANGNDGSNGNNGADGKDGATGATGPGPTDDQVAAAVSNYCSNHGDCKGASGQDGVVNVNSDCDAPDGQVIDQVMANYNTDSKTINITCSYKSDAQVLPGNGGS